MKRSRFISKIKYPYAQIPKDSFWIRKLSVSPINHPLVIQIKKKMDILGFRYEIAYKAEHLFFDRETIIENYEPRTAPKDMTIDWQIAEIKGYRFYEGNGEVWARGNYKDSPEQPASLLKSYSKYQKLADGLLEEMKHLFPEFRNYMGGVELLVQINRKTVGFKEKTKPQVIAKAYLEIFS